MSASDISMKLRHLAHLENHKRKAVSELMVCSAHMAVPKLVKNGIYSPFGLRICS